MSVLSGLRRDLIHAARSLAQARAFTLVCVVSLGIGMVPVIAVPYFARITRTPPPGVKPAGLVELVTAPVGPREARDAWSYPDFVDLRAADTGMAITAWINGQMKTRIQAPGGQETTAVETMFVSANYFSTVGAILTKGRGFDAAADDARKAQPEVILGNEFWQRQFGADPDIVGKTLTLNDVPHVVVGVTPERFEGHLFLHGRDVFVPLERYPPLRDASLDNKFRSDRSQEWLFVIGRLSPGVDLARANATVAAVTSQLATQYPATNASKAGLVAAYHPSGTLHRTQFLLLQTVALTLTGTVLLVVCLNISGMMQVRSAMRERELSIRSAIGASRGRLIQYLLSEAIILAGLGGTLGSIVLFSIPPVLFRLLGRPLPFQLQQALRLDPAMVALCTGLCLVTSLVFGLLPAARFSRPAIISSLKDDAGVGGVRAGRVHRTMAALQVAIAVPLIVMSGMSLDRMRATATSNLGFDAELLYAAPLKLAAPMDANALFRIRGALDEVAKADGVASVTVTDGLPLDFGGRDMRVSMQAQENLAPKFISARVTRVGDGYLSTMGIRLVRGRGFTTDDRSGAEKVVVISQPLADRLYPDGDVIGKQLMLGDDEKTRQALTVVGVIGDFPTSQMSTTREQLLLPMSQQPSTGVFLVARLAAGEPPAKLTAALENAVHDFAPYSKGALTYADGLPFPTIVTGVWLRQNSVRDFLVQSAVAGGAGSVILILSALGIYGVVGLIVATRIREIAVRVALGASRRRVMAMILFDVVKLVSPGVAVGLVLTAALNRLNSENMGISLSNVEPLAYVAGAAIAVLVAVLASLAPARRAASIQPMVAMRSA